MDLPQIAAVSDFARLARYRRSRYRADVARQVAVFLPENPREQERAEAHGHVGDVERRPTRDLADANVDEIDHSLNRRHPVDQVADGAAADERERHDTGRVTRSGAPI